ncbi:t-SNARE [Coniochaeta ligniaria NRRL 30616]|uniref:t-SNARE n=1 Tax=Coniochaeta ligniaria NRRL 30616 TaxID=1408157 RepID=A0A1J7I866_9PEZI|nr:t-SNARE [Coniochaeta ligniaria NRRL 30616]
MSYGGYQDQGNPYGTPYNSASNTEAGYGRGQEQHELQNYQPGQYESYGQQQSHNAPAASGGYGDYSTPAASNGAANSFFGRRDYINEQIRELDGELVGISEKQDNALGSTTPEREQQQIQEMIQRFKMTASGIRSQIQSLKNEAGADKAQEQHVDLLMKNFKSKYDRLLQLESSYNQKVRTQMARQYQIVNPDASLEEALGAVQDQSFQDGGVFAQAIRSERTNQARSVLGNVQARHNEIKRIEESIMELANLFQDLDTMVVQQEDTIVNAERQTEQTNENIYKGTEEVDKGIVHARRTRRNKWICLGIVILIILIAIAIGVGVGLTNRPPK